jgi:hypothetical protein
MVSETTEAFAGADLPAVLRLLDKHFVDVTYSLKSLFRDEQRKILDIVLGSTLSEMEASNRQVYEHHAPLMRFLSELGIPLPPSFRAAAELVLNSALREAVRSGVTDFDHAQTLLRDVQDWKVNIDAAGIAFDTKRTIDRLADDWWVDPTDMKALSQLGAAVALAKTMPFQVDLWKAQNVFYEVLQAYYPDLREPVDGEEEQRAWTEQFVALGERLSVRVD